MDVGELAGERDIYGSVLSAHPDTRGGGHLQTAGAQPIETPACPTTALSTAPGTGTRTEPTPAPGQRTARESSSPYNDDQGSTTTHFLRTRKGRFVDIEVPGSQVTGALKINDRRQVVGLYVDAGAQPDPDGSLPPGAIHGFVWHDGDYTTVDVPGAAATVVLGINNRGQMVGSSIDPEGGYHGFLRDNGGAVTTLPEAPGADLRMEERSPAASTTAARSWVLPTTPRAAHAASGWNAASSHRSTRRPTRCSRAPSTSTIGAGSSATTARGRLPARPPRAAVRPTGGRRAQASRIDLAASACQGHGFRKGDLESRKRDDPVRATCTRTRTFR